MTTLVRDIESEEDIKCVVDNFYNKVQDNKVIGHYFKDVHWPDHLPTMYAFWSAAVLHKDGYRGNPFEKHVKLPQLRQEHFKEWLSLFTETIDEHFEGKNALEMKHRGETIAFIFQSKLVKPD